MPIRAGRDGQRLHIVAGSAELFVELGQNLAATRLHAQADRAGSADGERRDVNLFARRQDGGEIRVMIQPVATARRPFAHHFGLADHLAIER